MYKRQIKFTTAANDGAGNSDIIDFEEATTLATANKDISFVGGGISAAANGANITITTGSTAASKGDVTLTDITVTSEETISVLGTTISAQKIGDATTEAGVVSLEGAITLNDSIYTDDVTSTSTAGDVTLTGAVSLAADITIDTSDGDGLVKFTSTVDSATTTAKGLTIKSGAGKVTIDGKIGASDNGGTDFYKLAALSINATDSTGEIELFDIGDSASVGTSTVTVGNADGTSGGTTTITLDGIYYRPGGTTLITAKAGDNIKVTRAAGTGDVDFVMAANSLEFATADVLLSDDRDLDIDSTGTVTIAGIDGNSSEAVAINSSGTITLGTIGTGVTNGIGDITIDGNGSIVLTNNITSYKATGSTVKFDGAVVIKGDVTITTDTSTGHATDNDGYIDFFGAPTTILGHTSGTNNLTLLSGSGTIDLDGKIGATSGSELDKLHINASASAAAALNIPQIGADASTPGTTGETKIGNASSGIITLSGDTYAFGGGDTTITSGDDIKLTANSANNTKGTMTTDANTLTIVPGTNKALEFSGTAKISGANTSTIDIQGDVLGVDNGGSVEIIEISVATAGEVKVTGDIKAADASGAHAGKIKTITLSGPGTGTGTGVYIGGELVTAVAATGNNIDINGNVLLTGNTTLDTTANDGTIDFSGKIDSSSATNNTLTLKSAAGSITVNGVIGGTNDIGALSINDGLTGAGTITLSGVGAISGTPKIGITGSVDIGHTSTAKVILNGTEYNIDGDTTITTTTGANKAIIGDALTIKTDGHFTKFVGGKIDLAGTDGLQDGHNLTITAGSGDVTVTDIAAHSSELIDIEGATVTVGVIGASDEIKSVTLDGSTKVVLGGNITTSNITGNNILIKGPAEIAADITLDTSAKDGTITFNGTGTAIDSISTGAKDLTLTSAGGKIQILSLIHI